MIFKYFGGKVAIFSTMVTILRELEVSTDDFWPQVVRRGTAAKMIARATIYGRRGFTTLCNS